MTVAAQAGRIPGVTAIDHIAYNVPHLDEAIAFFVAALGCRMLSISTPRPFQDHADSSVVAALLRYDDRLTIELLEFHLPGQNTRQPTLTDTSGYHLALAVRDIDAAVNHLHALPGVQVGPVDAAPDGRRRVFFRTPWGMPMQLLTSLESGGRAVGQ
jgi:catechol 2,3-dioxygenase-like lactoylglutathione lyase family enzyme